MFLQQQQGGVESRILAHTRRSATKRVRFEGVREAPPGFVGRTGMPEYEDFWSFHATRYRLMWQHDAISRRTTSKLPYHRPG